MRGLLLFVARLAGALGFVVGAVAGIARLAGHFELGGFTTATLLLAGMALLVLGCFCYLAILVENPWPHD